MSYVKIYNFQNILKRILSIQRQLKFIRRRTFGAPRWPSDKVSGFSDKMLRQRDVRFARKKKYGRCSDTTTNNTQDTITTTLIYLMQPYDTSNSYFLFSTAVQSPEYYCMSTGMQRFVRIRARAV